MGGLLRGRRTAPVFRSSASSTRRGLARRNSACGLPLNESVRTVPGIASPQENASSRNFSFGLKLRIVNATLRHQSIGFRGERGPPVWPGYFLVLVSRCRINAASGGKVTTIDWSKPWLESSVAKIGLALPIPEPPYTSRSEFINSI